MAAQLNAHPARRVGGARAATSTTPSALPIHHSEVPSTPPRANSQSNDETRSRPATALTTTAADLTTICAVGRSNPFEPRAVFPGLLARLLIS